MNNTLKNCQLLLLACILLPACAEAPLKYEGKPNLRQGLYAPDVVSLNRTPVKLGSRPVWERWQTGLDRRGQPIADERVVQADSLREEGKAAEALELYRAVAKQNREALRETMAERVAALELSLDKPREALATLSAYFRSLHATVGAVDSDLSLIFAYAYGRQRNAEQSLAWFDKILQSPNEALARKELARRGVARLLGALSSQELESLSQSWTTHEEINLLVGQERKRRAELGIPANLAAREPFWEEFNDRPAATQFVQTESAKRVAVMLPLSGRYGPLGEKLQHGIELARDSFPQREQIGFDFTFEDTSSEPGAARASFERAVSPVAPLMILGPLLAESAAGVADISRERGVPMLSFSKRNDLKPGRGVYRLAPTAESQVKALIDSASNKLGLSHFGIVATDDAFGQEYVKAFRAELERRGLQVEFEQLYASRDDVAIFKMAQSVEKTSVDTLMIADPSVANATHVFLSILEERRQNITVLGPAGWDNMRELKKVQNALEGALMVVLFPQDSERNDVQDFIVQYNKRFGVKPDFFAAQGFDAATLVMSAVARALSSNRPVNEAFATLEAYRGLTGDMIVSASGEVERALPVMQFHKGELVEPRPPLITSGPEQQPIGSITQ